MSKINLLIDLKGYDGETSGSTLPSFAKNSNWNGIVFDQKTIAEYVVKSNSSKILFSSSIENIKTVITYHGSDTIDIDDQQKLEYIEIPQRIIPKSLILSVDRLMAVQNVDYQVEVNDTFTKITWINSLAQGGDEALAIGDSVNVSYSYSDLLTVDDLKLETYNATSEFNPESYKFVYIECDGECDIAIDGIVQTTVRPVIINGVKKNGVYLSTCSMESVSIINRNDYDIKAYCIAAK